MTSSCVRLALLSGAAWVLAVAAPSDQQQSAEHASSLHVIAIEARAEAAVEIVLPRADVEVRSGREGAVRVRLQTLAGPGGARAHPDSIVSIERVGDLVRLATRRAEESRGVAVVVELPPLAVVKVRLQRGDVAVSGTAGVLDLATERGDVRLLRTSGSALVSVKNGSVGATLAGVDSRLPSAYTTLNGNVELSLPVAAAVDLDVRCRGCTLQDVRLEAEVRRTSLDGTGSSEPIRALHARLSGGGPALQVFTWNGEVMIRQQTP